ncbi:unnamed protein product [Thlaspi arvense]|uniref:MATH domain-containing protein n=1 Tax=Thlaspi arvense TaxID=13288 RepID=A0AAU9RNZ1_THLAR|nr:unnamed protein product [Thlaspi arvense]
MLGMSETTNEDSGGGRSVEESSNGQRSQSAEALAEWRSSDRVENGTPSTSPPYWDIDEEDDFGLKPSELFGKDTWKIEKFSEINKRELRGDVFEVGGYKWFHVTLMAGWSHFAQFTIAVINKDPKKSKHSEQICGRFVEERRSRLLKLIEDKAKWKRAALEPLPKGPQNRTKDVNAGEFRTEAIERDEKRLTELGRRTVEIFALTHIFSTSCNFSEKCSNKIEVAYQEAIAWRRQEELIREEEEEVLAENEQKAKRRAAEKEKKSKKKQAKQKKNKNRGKEKRKEEKVRSQSEERDIAKEESVRAKEESSAEKPDTHGDVSDVSDSVDSSADILQLDSEDRESSPVHWEIDASETHPPPSLGDTSSRGRDSSISIPNGVAERKCISTMDDSSSTCSNDSIRSGGGSGSYKGSVSNYRSQKWLSKTQPGKVSDANSLASETEEQPSRHASEPKNQRHSSEIGRVVEADVVISHIHKPQSPEERNPVSKDHSTVRTQVKSPVVHSSPRAAHWNHHPSSVAQAKPEKKIVSNVDTAANRKAISSARSPSSDQQASPSRDIQFQTMAPRADVQKTISPTKRMAQPAPPSILSRPLSAPLIPPKQAAPVVISPAQASTTSLARSMSSTGRVGSPIHSQTYIPQSYKHAIVGSFSFSNSSSQPTGTTTAFPSYSHPPPPPVSLSNQPGFSWDVSSGGRGLWTGGSNSNRETPTTSTTINHRMNLPYNTPVSTSFLPTDVQFGRTTTQSLMTDEFPHLDIINDLLEDEHGSMDNNMYRVPQRFNNIYSYHGGADFGISGRSRSYSDDGFHQSYGEYMSPSSSSSSPYGNGLTQTQWRMANLDLSLLAMRNQDDAALAASNYSYFDLDSSNQNLSAGINGYRDFRPSNGH